MSKVSFSDYWHAIGTDAMLLVLKKAKVDHKYASQIKTGLKVPGRQTALALLDAARAVTPGFEPHLEAMLRGKPRVKAKPRKIPPSAAFASTKKSGQSVR